MAFYRKKIQIYRRRNYQSIFVIDFMEQNPTDVSKSVTRFFFNSCQLYGRSLYGLAHRQAFAAAFAAFAAWVAAHAGGGRRKQWVARAVQAQLSRRTVRRCGGNEADREGRRKWDGWVPPCRPTSNGWKGPSASPCSNLHFPESDVTVTPESGNVSRPGSCIHGCGCRLDTHKMQ